VNTNIGAMVALQSLNRTNDEMAVTQKRISTGLRVADAKDDGAAFAVAQSVRSDIAGLTAANEQLGATQGLLETTNSALKKVSESMTEVRKVLTALAGDRLSDDERDQYEAQYTALQTQIQASWTTPRTTASRCSRPARPPPPTT
jgi:flagellin